MSERRIALVTFGSLGDLHPFIAVAHALKARGYAPVIATTGQYRENVAAAGLAFHSVRPAVEDLLRDMQLERSELTRRLMDDPSFMFKRVMYPYLRAAYDDLVPVIDGAALAVTSSLAFSARIAAEHLNVPQVGIVLQPLMFLSAYDPPRLHNASWFQPVASFIGPRMTGGVFRGLKKMIVRESQPIHSLRRELGLPAASRDPLFDGQAMLTARGSAGRLPAVHH